MWLDKAADLGAGATSWAASRWSTLIVEHTHTCYLGDREQRHAWGYGCGNCPACALRKLAAGSAIRGRRGFEQLTVARAATGAPSG